MKRLFETSVEFPEFLVKTSLGCSLVVILILVPFTVNNFLQARFDMGLATLAVTFVCLINVWNGFKGRYSLWANTYLLTPIAMSTIIFAMFALGGRSSYWPILMALAYYFVLPLQRAMFFNILTIIISIPVAWQVLDTGTAVRFVAVLVGVSLFAWISIREINLLHRQLKEQAVTDKLTGLFNRHLLETSLQQAVAQHQRLDIPLSLISLDIDHFKMVNDRHGHDVGDDVLRKLGTILKGRFRGSDLAFRTGGEEFLVLLYNSDAKQGAQIAETLRADVEGQSLLPGQSLTISLGVAGYQPDLTIEDWLKTADERLYTAKQTGRNRVVAAEPG